MNKIIERLIKLKSKYPIEEHFRDKIENSPIPIKPGTSFEQNIYLKENLHKALADTANLENHYWTIRGWGKLRNFKKIPRNDDLIRNFLTKLEEQKNLTRAEASVLSSLSKVASFAYPQQFAIYDSKAIYSLNWLLIRHVQNPMLFPQPKGRGEIADVDMQTLIDLSELKHSYRSYQTAYYEYCKLMKEFSEKIYDAPNKPYLAEMLLFRIAVEEIIKDLKKSTKVTITTDYQPGYDK